MFVGHRGWSTDDDKRQFSFSRDKLTEVEMETY